MNPFKALKSTPIGGKPLHPLPCVNNERQPVTISINLYSEAIEYQADSNLLFEPIHQQPGAVFLDSGNYHSAHGATDIITAFPQQRIRYDGHTLKINNSSSAATLEQAIARIKPLLNVFKTTNKNSSFNFIGGLIFQSSYELGAKMLGIDSNASADDLAMLNAGIYHWCICNDHHQKTTTLISVSDQGREQLEQYKQTYYQQRATPLSSFTITEAFSPSMSRQQYQHRFEQIKRYIVAGDCYQVNFSQHFQAGYQGNSWQAYKALKSALPSPYSAYFNTGDHQILSLSPERFIQVENGKIETKPIKGTRRRGHSSSEDQQLVKELQQSGKDRAENLMIVDLLRNDISKSAKHGSVRVPKLFEVESFANVHHLVSTITAELAEDCSQIELLSRAFPGGSITGAPKKRSMEIIAELEQIGRSAYCGSIGYVSFNGYADSNIAIRTMVADGQHIHCWGGGGIVMDSDLDEEYQESLTKVQLLMTTLENL
ncbi:Aminodeoxychorismate synthase component 1 [Sinobacterium norvegicum]|uniref:Aminodeoxychorismate synthase component 1 n=1 Tax=Sinobacterium norvegicum TaxID=1641715 RepID=A0ABM9AC59_9GAMM|nr:aminodeoxychorismate synthase component I [Sinobacterium norvegicum]CAH0990206.1 Aminodeoxychorismate synthase component 1 [Sinobacterium norvegicum]